ncbi:MAG: hypothetical protein Kapaf2KO_14230 [Candidatus Kapaibacteriales bacterium]
MNHLKVLAASNIMAELSADTYYANQEYRERKQLLAGLGVTGFCVFRGELEATKKMIAELQEIAEDRLIFSGDFEYGLPMRLVGGGTAFPHPMALGKNDDNLQTYKIARLNARECKHIGVTWNFAPVVDINSNPKNPIINIRSFGEDKLTVSKHSSAFIKGLQDEGVLATAKHFPGHGDTEVDSHMALPTLPFSKERLEVIELFPFKKAIENGVRSIMIGHLSVPSLDDTGMPASLSPVIIGLLREELEFDGLIVTDALRMKAISERYGSGLACELALRAGNTIALMPEDEMEAIMYLADVAKSDIEFSKVLETNRIKFEKLSIIEADKNSKSEVNNLHEKVALQSAFKALIINDKNTNLPLDTNKKIASFAFLQHEKDLENASTFFHLLQQAFEKDVDFGFLDQNIETNDLIELKQGIHDAEILVFAFFFKAMDSSGTVGDYSLFRPIVERLAEGREYICISLGSPYIFEGEHVGTTILTYSDSLSSQAASIMSLLGRDLKDMNADI